MTTLTSATDRIMPLRSPDGGASFLTATAQTALNALGLAVTALLGFAVGFRTHADLAAVVVAFALFLAVVHAFSWLFISLGLRRGNAQAAQALSTLIVVPLSFVSAGFVPIRSMPGWMQAFAANQPVTAMINAVRSLMLGGTHAAGIGHTTTYWVLLSLAWCAGILAVFGTVAVTRFGRTR